MSIETARITPAEYMARPDYLPGGEVLSSVGWMGSGAFDYLTKVGTTRERGILTMVGLVAPERLMVDTLGNYNPRFNQLKKAKFQFSLTCPPPESGFHSHFQQGMQYLTRLQSGVAKTANNHKYMLVIEGGEGGSQAIRLSQDMFERRSLPLNVHDTTDPTVNWVVPQDHARALMDIAPTFSIRPMMAYDINDKLINPEFVAATLSGALVEVSFTIRHMTLKDGPELADIFTASFVQIRVIQCAPPIAADPFRENPQAGPLVGGVRIIPVVAAPVNNAGPALGKDSASSKHPPGQSFNSIMADLNHASFVVQPAALPAAASGEKTSSTALASPFTPTPPEPSTPVTTSASGGMTNGSPPAPGTPTPRTDVDGSTSTGLLKSTKVGNVATAAADNASATQLVPAFTPVANRSSDASAGDAQGAKDCVPVPGPDKGVMVVDTTLSKETAPEAGPGIIPAMDATEKAGNVAAGADEEVGASGDAKAAADKEKRSKKRSADTMENPVRKSARGSTSSC
ncbi:hypothetical protein BKA70DRAFT_1242082 [Coprinopsis sp. MPI-PUGE-AT-0042]|nr:hypothetical protein BKA70DRAFT_1242082 [Coprinopsis sp. MPI-PUGE-AT-0042]